MTVNNRILTRVFEIIKHGEYIQNYIKGKTFEDYEGDIGLRHSVERCLEIVGLSMAKIRDTDISVADSFTDYHKIIALRNVLAHTYFKSKVRQIWNAVQENLPILLNEARLYINTNLDDKYRETF